jgi:hypothetical protein
MRESSGGHRSHALYQGTTLVGPFQAHQDLGFKPLPSFFASELSSHKHFVQDAPWQGLKPNSLSVLYGPTKVVP